MIRFIEQPDGRVLLADDHRIIATLHPDGRLDMTPPSGATTTGREHELVLIPLSDVHVADRLLCEAGDHLPHMVATITGVRAALASYLKRAA